MAGLRIAVVTMISLATVAAFVVPQGLGAADLRALRDVLQDRDHRRGRARGRCSRSSPTRCSSCAARAHAVDASEGVVILFDDVSAGTFLDGFRFIVDNWRADAGTRPWSTSSSRGAALGVAIAIAHPDRRLARPLAPRLVRRHQRLQHRPRAAQPGGDRHRHRDLRHRLHERDVRARRARRPADPHERLRGGRRGRPRRRRGRARDGHARARGALPRRAAARRCR